MNETCEFPIVRELTPVPDVELALARFASKPHCLMLDSARRDPQLGRYSFLAADPFEFCIWPVRDLPFGFANDHGHQGGAGHGKPVTPLAELQSLVAPYTSATIEGLPPFQGGVAGLFSYDLNRSLERLPAPRADEFALPAMAIGFYDVVLAWDHETGRAWLFSHGYPAEDTDERRRRARQRLDEATLWLERPPSRTSVAQSVKLPLSGLATQYPVAGYEGLTSNLSAAQYLDAARRAIEYIRAGDVFQVNLAQRLLHPANDDSLSLYLRLRRCNPATFAGYFDLGQAQLLSASPERFLKLFAGAVETRPIKGTRQRSLSPEADLFAGDELLASQKDRAENVMIVDLLRNDLSRVCSAESVKVTQLCRVESYEYVQHLVSAVCGALRADCGPLDLLAAAFPGGSITGAPKVRAMEIIAELEPTARGAYCGSLGYLGFDGAMDTSILIRTITAANGWWQAPVGGGIVAQSSPRAEYEETWHKATGLLRALA